MDASSPENKAPLRKEVSDSIDALISLLKSQLHLTSLILAILSKQDFAKGLKTSPTEVGGDIALSLVNLYLAMGISANSFVTLAKTPGLPTRDCYTIARSVLETAVNICFIIARGKEAARQAIAHSRQKAYRDMDRESRIGESVIKVFVTDKPDPQLIKGISGDLAKFTTKGGGEKRDWVDLSIDQRIESASKELGG